MYEVICDYYKHVLSIFHHLNQSWGTYPTYTRVPLHSDNDKISPEQWGASIEDEVAISDHGVVPLPMGIEGWTDMREHVYRPTRGQWQHIGGDF